VDSLTPLHIVLITAIVAVILGPERAGRLAGQIVRHLRTYRQVATTLTPSGMASALYRAVSSAAVPPDGAPR
jgi:Sec-independent protein translocase protein TatA